MSLPPTTRASSSRIRSTLELPFRPPMGQPAAFTWRFGRFYAYTYTSSPNLEKPSNPLYEFSRRKWAARQEPLWLSIIAKKHTGEGNSRCVRSWLARRLRIAFAASLKKNGYAPDGTRLEGTEAGSDLIGTVQMLAIQEMIKMDQADVQAQTDKAVLLILQNQEEGMGLPMKKRWVKRS